MSEKSAEKGKRMARNWGQHQAAYLAALETQAVKVAFSDGKVLRGTLTGVDTCEIFVKPARGPEVLISKGRSSICSGTGRS